MHRSGTSIVTRLLSLLGGSLPSWSFAADCYNIDGYFEPRDIVAIHERLLLAINRPWTDVRPLPPDTFCEVSRRRTISALVAAVDRQFDGQPLPLIKDPRLCRLLPLWQLVLSHTGHTPLVIIPFRRPAAVAHSLRQRSGLDEATGFALWLRYVLEAEHYSRGLRRIFVSYADVTADPVLAVDAIGRGSCGALHASRASAADILLAVRPPPSPPTDTEAEHSIPIPMLAAAEDTYRHLTRLTVAPDDRAALKALDSRLRDLDLQTRHEGAAPPAERPPDRLRRGETSGRGDWR
jgi:hypothetical protein